MNRVLKVALWSLAAVLTANPLAADCSCSQPQGIISCIMNCCSIAMPGMQMQHSTICSGMEKAAAVIAACGQQSCAVAPSQLTAIEKKINTTTQLDQIELISSAWTSTDQSSHERGERIFLHAGPDRHLLLRVFRI